MRWTFLAIAVGAFASLWGIGPDLAMPVAFLVLFTNFATFCLLYDRPKNRARHRIVEQLRGLHPNSDVAQRLSTATISTIPSDHRLGLGPMTLLNLATAIASAALLLWGISLRVF